MKVLLFVSSLILVVSCGKYERPFISFKSPEKRLTDNTWSCEKAVSEDGTEFQVEDRITFAIDGTFERITSYLSFKPLNNSAGSDPTVLDTIQGTWYWLPAMNGEVNKQMLIVKYDNDPFGRNNYVTVLSRKEFVYQDQSLDNTTYHYKKL